MRIAFQGDRGSYSDLAVRKAFPREETVPYKTFELAIQAIQNKEADLALLPCENSLHGRVAGIHLQLPKSGLYIIGEKFQRVEHCLLAPEGATLKTICYVHSQDVAHSQVRKLVQEFGFTEIVEIDTAYAAKEVARLNDREHASISSSLAAEIYGLNIVRRNVEDESHNTTRFYVVSPTSDFVAPDRPDCMTTFAFRVHNRHGSLLKALAGFATAGVNMTKLESYMLNGEFVATQFLCEAEGHPKQAALGIAMEELSHHAKDVRVLGVYPQDPYRQTKSQTAT